MTAPTVYDVADKAGVSIATVSRVYGKPGTVRAQTRDRVLAAARELGYVPSGSARGLARRSTGVLGLCFPDHADSAAQDDADEVGLTLYADEIIRGMERAARRHGYPLLIAASLRWGPENLLAKVAGRVDGFAVLARTVPIADLAVVARRLPVVLIAGPREIDHLDHLEVANADGEYALTRHLIEDHGLTRLRFVGGGADSPDAEARFHGYQRACRDAGLPVPASPDIRGALAQDAGELAVERLLTPGAEPPHAMIFANDQMAVGALRVLDRRGVRVPDDLAVVGFDGIPLGQVVRPALTTVRQPMRHLGELAADFLVERLNAPDLPPRSLLLPVTQIRRASCGCRA